MKKLFLLVLLSVAMIMQSCVTASPNMNKVFIGKWKKVGKPNEELDIQRDGKAFLITIGKDKFSFVSDKDRNVLRLYFMQTIGIIRYVEKTDHIVFNQDDGGEYARVQ